MNNGAQPETRRGASCIGIGNTINGSDREALTYPEQEIIDKRITEHEHESPSQQHATPAEEDLQSAELDGILPVRAL